MSSNPTPNDAPQPEQPQQPKAEPPNPNQLTREKAIQMLQLIAAIVVMLAFIYLIKPSKSGSSGTSGSSSTPIKGEQRYLEVDGVDFVLVAVSENALDELNSYSSRQNADGLKQLIRQGRALNCRRGTRVSVIDPGFASTTVRILSGPHEGSTGIVPNEFLRK